MSEHIWYVGIILSDVYAWEAAAPRALLPPSSLKISHRWALRFALRDPRALFSKLGSHPEGTGNSELMLLLVDSSWHPLCKGVQSLALKKQILLKGCQALLWITHPFWQQVFSPLCWGTAGTRVIKCKWSPFAPACATIAVPFWQAGGYSVDKNMKWWSLQTLILIQIS